MAIFEPDSDERLFLRVVEAGSLKAAAELVGSDPSAVSRRLAALEARLGQQLMRRSTRGSRPTEAGARYYEGLAPLVAQQDALEAAIAGAGDAPQGLLRVAAPPEFGVRFVVPVLEAMQAAHPELAVELSLGTAFTNLSSDGLDVAIRIGTLGNSSLRTRRLGQVPRVLVGADAYLEQHGTPARAADLSAHRFLGYLAARGGLTLKMKTPEGRPAEVPARAHFTVNSIQTLVRQVEAGAGLCLGPRWAFADSIAAGRAKALLTDHFLPAYPVQALFPTRRYLPAKTRAFIEAMAAAVAEHPSLEA